MLLAFQKIPHQFGDFPSVSLQRKMARLDQVSQSAFLSEDEIAPAPDDQRWG